MEERENKHIKMLGSHGINNIVENMERKPAFLSRFNNTIKAEKQERTLNSDHKGAVKLWSLKRTNDTPPSVPPAVPIELQSLKLFENFDKMYDAINTNDVLLIEAPTGAGKSVLPPSLFRKLAYEIGRNNSQFPSLEPNKGYKVVHTATIGEQAVQHVDFLKTECSSDGTNIECYTAVIDQETMTDKKWLPPSTEYLYCTVFYAKQAVGGKLHGLIIDEVHDLTPDLVEMFHRAREELKVPHDKRTLNKVILLSATISDSFRQNITNYFTSDRFSYDELKFVDPPYEIKTIELSDTENFVVKDLEYAKMNDNLLYEKECDDNGPEAVELRTRANEVLISWMQFVDKEKENKRPFLFPGAILFYPGDHDVGRGRAMLFQSEKYQAIVQPTEDGKLWKGQNQSVEVFRVSGKGRSDLKFLKKKFKHQSDPTRIVQSTPLLCNGVTVPGTGVVIDTCSIKIPRQYSHTGIIYLVTKFQDYNMTMQKKGRCGRESNGMYFPIVSEERLKSIMDTDHSLTRLDRSYRSNDMVYVLDFFGELMYHPEPDTMEELIQEMRNTGFITDRLPGDRYPKPTAYGRSLSNSFSTTSLAMADFLLRCHSYGISLHGIIFVASCKSEFRCIRRPNSAGGGPGRDDPDLPIWLWCQRTLANFDSDIETSTELSLNLMLADVLNKKMRDGRAQHRLCNAYIPQMKVFNDKDGTKDLHRQFLMIYSNLYCAGFFPKATFGEFLIQSLTTQYTRQVFSFPEPNNPQSSYNIYRLNKDQRRLFKMCLLQSFGSRVLYRGNESDQWASHGNRVVFKLGGKVEDVSTRLVQGEIPIHTRCPLAIYNEIVLRKDGETRMTGYLEYTPAVFYALFGNVIGACMDEINVEKLTMKIVTNTSPIYVEYSNRDTLLSVIRIRRILRSVPIHAFTSSKESHKHFMDEIMGMVWDLHSGDWMNADIRVYEGDESVDQEGYVRAIEVCPMEMNCDGLSVPTAGSSSTHSFGSSSTAVLNESSVSRTDVSSTQSTQVSQSVLYNELLADEQSQPLPATRSDSTSSVNTTGRDKFAYISTRGGEYSDLNEKEREIFLKWRPPHDDTANRLDSRSHQFEMKEKNSDKESNDSEEESVRAAKKHKDDEEGGMKDKSIQDKSRISYQDNVEEMKKVEKTKHEAREEIERMEEEEMKKRKKEMENDKKKDIDYDEFKFHDMS